ncbi:MAG: hypothetical protein IJM99_10910 [Firmicutes bacterium]|nr:hypothetical protein [Bacillota bacterium]
MSRTTREEHNRICEQCQRVEKELERLRVVLNDAEDQVKKLEVKMFPGRNRMLRDAAEREADARAAYSDAQHRLDDIKRQERLLRMKMRREESDVSVDDIPEVDVDDIPDATMEDIQDVEIDDVPVIEVADMNMPDVDRVVVDVDEPEREEPVAETPLIETSPKVEPRHCEEDHVYEDKEEDGWVRYEEEESSGRDHRERTRTDDILDSVFDKGENLWNQAKKTWRVINKMDVPQDESLRLEIMSLIYEIETKLREVRDMVGVVKVLGALKATNDLANLKPKIQRLSQLVDSARMECPQIHFPAISLPGADGFSLLEDVLNKNQVSTVQEIDAFLMTLSRLKTAVKKMPEREGVVDQL